MAETEKTTINMSVVDLGKIDLLVDAGFYQNRTDFIRNAIRLQLEKHAPTIESSIVRHSYGLGIFACSRKDLEKAAAKGEKKRFEVVGMLVIEKDVSPELAKAVIETINVRGVLKAPDPVKEALKDRIL